MANDQLHEWLKAQIQELVNGGNRRANQASQGSAPNQSNSCAGGASSQGARQGALQNHTHTAHTNQGTSVSYSTTLASNLPWMVVWDPSSWTPPTGKCARTGRWCPPRMSGMLGIPNNAMTWVPHEVCHMKSEGVQAGEIIAWRAWYWDAKRQRLRSIFVDYDWPINEPAKGEPAKGYGIHAFKTKQQVFHEYTHHECIDDLIVGKVALWGDVIEYEGGYCAEFGRPHALYHGRIPAEALKLYGLV